MKLSFERSEVLPTSLQQQVCSATLWETETLPKPPQPGTERPKITPALTSVMSTTWWRQT